MTLSPGINRVEKCLRNATTRGNGKIMMPDGRTGNDLILDDSALAMKNSGGHIVIMAATIRRICNIAGTARKIYREERVADIICGLLLLSTNGPALEKKHQYLHDLRLNALYAGHFTTRSSKIFTTEKCSVTETGVNMDIEWQ